MLLSNDLVKSFVIGSSFPVFIYYFLRVYNIPKIERNYSYFHYTIVNPLYFGLINALLTYLHTRYDINREHLYLWTGLVSATFVFLLAVVSQSYDFTQRSYLTYYLTLLITHTITYSYIILPLEKIIQN